MLVAEGGLTVAVLLDVLVVDGVLLWVQAEPNKLKVKVKTNSDLSLQLIILALII